MKKSGGVTTYYHADHVGATNVVSDSAGTAKYRIEYDPWGQISYFSGTEDPALRLSTAELQPEASRTRPYDPTAGRFMTPELASPLPGDPQGLNGYTYAKNNGLNPPDGGGLGRRKELFWRGLFQSLSGGGD
jgi:RHS repeat-associated protein